MSESKVLHMMALEKGAPHLSHRYHVYITQHYPHIRAYQRVIERDYDPWHNQYHAHGLEKTKQSERNHSDSI